MYMSIALISVYVNIRMLSPTNTGQTMVNNWRKHNDKQGKSTSLIEPPGYDRDKEMFVAPPSVPSQRQKCDSNEVQRVSAPSMNMRSAERSSHDLIRSHGCTDTLDTSGMLLCEYNNCHDSEEGPRIPHNCVSGRNGSDRLQGMQVVRAACSRSELG